MFETHIKSFSLACGFVYDFCQVNSNLFLQCVRRPLTLMMMRKTLSRELSIQKQMSSVVDYRRPARTFCCSRLLIRYAHSHTHRYEGYKTVNRRHPGCITPGLCAGQSVRFGLHERLITRALLKLPLSICHVRGTLFI